MKHGKSFELCKVLRTARECGTFAFGKDAEYAQLFDRGTEVVAACLICEMSLLVPEYIAAKHVQNCCSCQPSPGIS